jgi:hypothetical protein
MGLVWNRQTSIDAYNDIVARGLLPKQRLAVYRWVWDNGPCTASQIERGLGSKDSHKRTSELRDQGVLQEVGEDTCPVTGQQAIFWDVTGDRPRPYVNQKTERMTRKQLEAEVERLQDLNAKLELLLKADTQQLLSLRNPVEKKSPVLNLKPFPPEDY